MNVLNTRAGMVAVGVVAAGAVLYFFARQSAGALGDAAKAVGQAVNPTSDKNIAYRGVNAIGAAITGDGHWTLGGAIYDIFHPPYDPNQRTFSSLEPARAEDKPSSLR